ncbi:MAG: ABC transporter substrate-binding protein, partial [Oscillospiraceae bacterium]|nr:ABC transporter substrate-binding protein [Oscillospiraceae bacterium]
MKHLLMIVPLLALCLTLSGCLEPEPVEPEDFWEMDETIEIQPVEEAPTVFTLPYLSSQSLNPITCSDGVQQAAASLLYEGLFTLDAQFNVQNALCASYVRSGNGLSYTFTLRDGVTFTDGSSLTPADVVAAYRRAQVSDRYAARFANVSGIRAGRGTVILTLLKADSALPALLDIPIIKSGTDKYPVPIGTGPYRFVTDADGDCLLRNENWWGNGEGLPERIALIAAKDADAAAYLFTANRAHLLTADLLSNAPAASIGGVDLSDAPTSTLYYLGFNAKSGGTANKALRAAMNAALDR